MPYFAEVLGVKVRNLRDQWAWPEENNESNTAARTPGTTTGAESGRKGGLISYSLTD